MPHFALFCPYLPDFAHCPGKIEFCPGKTQHWSPWIAWDHFLAQQLATNLGLLIPYNTGRNSTTPDFFSTNNCSILHIELSGKETFTSEKFAKLSTKGSDVFTHGSQKQMKPSNWSDISLTHLTCHTTLTIRPRIGMKTAV